MQLRRNRIRFSRINHIFISHLHGDHIFGLYGLLSTFSLMGRKSPLFLYAPENYGPILNSHLEDFDIHLTYTVEFVPLSGKDPVKILDDKYVSVTSFPLLHRIPAFGFLFTEKGCDRKILKEAILKHNIPVSRIPSIKKGADFVRDDGVTIDNNDLTLPPSTPLSFAYCSDTRYFKRLASFIQGVTLLYHEATFEAERSRLAVLTGHSTTMDAANVAREAGAGMLIIGHFSARYKETDKLLTEAKSIFMNTLAAEEGKTYDLSRLDSF